MTFGPPGCLSSVDGAALVAVPVRNTVEDTMTNSPESNSPQSNAADEKTTTTTAARLGRPPVVDLATWQAARDALLLREKAHTRQGDAIAAARRRLPMVEFDGTV